MDFKLETLSDLHFRDDGNEARHERNQKLVDVDTAQKKVDLMEDQLIRESRKVSEAKRDLRRL